jgi:hypothetical protein
VNALAIVLALSLGPAAGFKAGTPTPTSDVSHSRVTATGSTTARALRDVHADVVNVLGFIPSAYHAGIAARTDTHDLTAYIQAAITAAGKGTVFFPLGLYNHTGILISDSVTLMGAGWSWDGSTLQNTHATNHGVSIINPDMIGARLVNLYVKGYSNVNPAVTGAAIYVRGEGNNLLDRVYMSRGYHGLQIDGNTSVLTVRDCLSARNLMDGIYGDPLLGQINAVNIITSNISQNGRHGINLWPTQGLNIRNNVIQGNTEIGILFDASGLGTTKHALDTTIAENWMEDNFKGAIVARTFGDSGTGELHYLRRLRIFDNVMSLYHPAAPATHYLVETTSTGAVSSPFQGFYLARNDYEGSGALAGYVYASSGAHDHSSVFDLSSIDVGLLTSFNISGGATIRGVEHWNRVSANVGDTSPALETRSSSRIVRFGSALTANREVTLPAAGMIHGDTFRIVRTGLGAFTLDVGPGLKTIPSATAAWVDVTYDGSAWVLTGYGTL